MGLLNYYNHCSVHAGQDVGCCYDHVQLRALSGYSGRIAALQLDSGHSSLTPVMVAQICLH